MSFSICLLWAPLAASATTIACAEDPSPNFPRSWVKSLHWRSIGPACMGGRVSDLAVVESDPTTWWIATASGGLLKTTNAGMTYQHQFDHEETVSIGAVAVAPSDPEVLWVGTGESNPRNSVSWGNGVYRSTNGGESWKHVGLEESFQIGRILIHPDDPEVAWVAALGRLWGENDARGLYKTTDAGKNWERVLYVDERTGVIDVDMHPSDPKRLLAATYERMRDEFDSNDPAVKWGPGAGVFASSDGGESWERVSEGLPRVDLGRIGLDWSRSEPETVFAVIESERIAGLPPDAAYLGLSAEDAEVGARVRRVAEDSPAEQAGLEVDDILILFDDEPVLSEDDLALKLRERRAGDEVVIQLSRNRELQSVELTLAEMTEEQRKQRPFSGGLGGQRENMQDQQGRDALDTGGVFRSDDGGHSWTRVNSLAPRPMYFSQIRVDPSDVERVYVLGIRLYRSEDGGQTFTPDGHGPEVHVDHHALWIDPKDGRHMLLGNDGGLYVTHDRMATWDHHAHLPIGQFYAVAADGQRDYRVYGGLQDNGSWGGPSRTKSGRGALNSDWFRVGGGDGFVCAVDPENPDLVYFESQNGGLGRIDLASGRSRFLRPRAEKGVDFRFHWKTPFLLSHQGGRVYYAAGNYVFRSLDRGDGLRPISPNIARTDKGSATALAESAADPERLYVGTDDGALWTSGDFGVHWQDLFELDTSARTLAEERAEREEVARIAKEAERAAKKAERAASKDQEDEEESESPQEAQPEEGAEPSSSEEAAITPERVPIPPSIWHARLADGRILRVEFRAEEDQPSTSLMQLGAWTAESETPVPVSESGQVSADFIGQGKQIRMEAELGQGKLQGALIAAGGILRLPFEARPGEAPEEGGEAPLPPKGSLAAQLPERFHVSSIEASHHDRDRVYVTFDGHRSDNDQPWVFVSEDAGTTWSPLHGSLPPGSARVLREDFANEDLLYLGTEFGAWISINRGVDWTRLNGVFPTVAVHEFAQPRAASELVLGTHGRGLWILDIAPLRQMTEKVHEAEAWLFEPEAVGKRSRELNRAPSGTRRYRAAAVPREAVIYVLLRDRAKDVELSILDPSGETLSELEIEKSSGLQRIVWDLRRDGRSREEESRREAGGEGQRRRTRGRSVGPGTYRVRLSVDHRSFEQSLSVE